MFSIIGFLFVPAGQRNAKAKRVVATPAQPTSVTIPSGPPVASAYGQAADNTLALEHGQSSSPAHLHSQGTYMYSFSFIGIASLPSPHFIYTFQERYSIGLVSPSHYTNFYKNKSNEFEAQSVKQGGNYGFFTTNPASIRGPNRVYIPSPVPSHYFTSTQLGSSRPVIHYYSTVFILLPTLPRSYPTGFSFLLFSMWDY